MPWLDNTPWDDAIEADPNVVIDPVGRFAYRPRQIVVPRAVWDSGRDDRGQQVFDQLQGAGAREIADTDSDPRGGQKNQIANELGFQIVELTDDATDPKTIIEGARDVGLDFHHVMFADPQRHGGCAPPQLLSEPVVGDAGEGRTIAVLDTDMPAQPPFAIQVVGQLQPEPEVPNGEAHGHGTMVADVVRRNAPAAALVARPVLDAVGVTDEAEVALALPDVVGAGADIINTSFGGRASLAAGMALLRAAVEAVPDTIVFVASAGNEGETAEHFPAAFDGVLAIASTWKLGTRWALEPYSNRGTWVSACTVGTHVEAVDHWGRPVLCTGTSFAAPTIAGKIAVLSARDGVDVVAARAALLGGSATLPDAGKIVP